MHCWRAHDLFCCSIVLFPPSLQVGLVVKSLVHFSMCCVYHVNFNVFLNCKRAILCVIGEPESFVCKVVSPDHHYLNWDAGDEVFFSFSRPLSFRNVQPLLWKNSSFSTFSPLLVGVHKRFICISWSLDLRCNMLAAPEVVGCTVAVASLRFSNDMLLLSVCFLDSFTSCHRLPPCLHPRWLGNKSKQIKKQGRRLKNVGEMSIPRMSSSIESDFLGSTEIFKHVVIVYLM